MGEPDHTQPSYRETPFFLVYRAEACLPPEIIMGSPRVQSFNESMQEQLWHTTPRQIIRSSAYHPLTDGQIERHVEGMCAALWEELGQVPFLGRILL
jgi:hypothetical protein